VNNAMCNTSSHHLRPDVLHEGGEFCRRRLRQEGRNQQPVLLIAVLRSDSKRDLIDC
jgi:hypothetical protein